MKINTITLLLFVLSVVLSLLLFRQYHTPQKEITTSDTIRITDTVIKFDTIKIIQPKYVYREVVRYDTVKTTIIPIEQRTYSDITYTAVIEGYKPSLLKLDIYQKTTHIFDTIRINNTITRYKQPKWAITAGVGVGTNGRAVTPYVGVSVGYVLWSK